MQYYRDFPSSPVVKTLPSNAEGASSIPGWGAKIPHCLGPKIQTSNMVKNSIKNLTMVHSKKCLKKILVLQSKPSVSQGFHIHRLSHLWIENIQKIKFQKVPKKQNLNLLCACTFICIAFTLYQWSKDQVYCRLCEVICKYCAILYKEHLSILRFWYDVGVLEPIPLQILRDHCT